MKWKDNKSTIIDNLALRLDKLEVEAGDRVVDANPQQEFTLEEKFNWFVKEIIPYYKAEVMRLHNISDEEYD